MRPRSRWSVRAASLTLERNRTGDSRGALRFLFLLALAGFLVSGLVGAPAGLAGPDSGDASFSVAAATGPGAGGTPLGVALYTGQDAALSGSCTIESPLVDGKPSAATYVAGKFKTSGSATAGQTDLHVGAQGDTVPLLSQFMPDALVSSLTTVSQQAQRTGTVYKGLKCTGGRGTTYDQPITVDGDLTISGSGVYSFDSVYVTGNVSISGSPTVSFRALACPRIAQLERRQLSLLGPYLRGQERQSLRFGSA